jgi:hypothetical protein
MTDLRDGRYEGGNRDFLVDLRVEWEGARLISADLFQAGTPGHEHVASVRIVPDAPSADGTWAAFYEAYNGPTSAGTLTVAPVADNVDAATVTFRAERPLNVLPAGADVVVEVRWTAAELRRLGLEMEIEEEVSVPEAFSVQGGKTTFPELMRRAGFQVRDIGRRTVIPRNNGGWRWDESVVYGVLDDLMRQTADDGLVLPAWKVHVLQLGRAARPGMLGVMFDLTTRLPRQGCAIFVEEIHTWVDEPRREERILQTMAHEVGHAFNLVHRFDTAVGQPGSASMMNYPDLYPDGEAAYWGRCAFDFDQDELAFLRHGPRAAVMPGAAPFRAFDYWGAAAQGNTLGPGVPTAGLDLSLAPPDNNGVFGFGQPIFLQVSLQNTGSAPVELPPQALDVKAGHLTILVERAPAFGGEFTGGGKPFVPMVRRCLAVVPEHDAEPPRLGPNQKPLRENVNLSFGGGGFPMAEPGEYHLTPALTLADGSVVRGSTLRIWVDAPADRRAERQGARLLQPDVGAWFVLGGTHALTGAHDEVREVLAERTHGRADPVTADPLAAAISRSLGIHASRTYLRLDGQEFRPQQADDAYATRVLRGLMADAGAARRCFDRSTIAATSELVSSLEERAGRP